MEDLTQRIRKVIKQISEVMGGGIEILCVGIENHMLREKLSELGYYEEAKQAEYHKVDINGVTFQGDLIKVGNRLYVFDGELMKDTEIIREVRYCGFGESIISYYKGGNLIKEEKVTVTPTPLLGPRY